MNPGSSRLDLSNRYGVGLTRIEELMTPAKLQEDIRNFTPGG